MKIPTKFKFLIIGTAQSYEYNLSVVIKDIKVHDLPIETQDILAIFLLGTAIAYLVLRSRKLSESVKNNDKSEIMEEEDTKLKNFVTKNAQSYAYNLRIVLSKKEKQILFLANLEELKSKGEVDELQYERMKKEYSGKVNTAKGEVEAIRKSIRSELDELEKDITAYSKERNDLNVRLQVGELTEEGVGKQIDDLENKVEGAKEEKSELEKLLQVEKSEILGDYININVRKKPDSTVLERDYPPESIGRITHTDNDFQKRPTLISAISGALAAFIMGLILSFILLQIGVIAMMSSSSNNPLGSLGAGLAKEVISSSSLQITGIIYYLAHGISLGAGALGSSRSMNIFMVMEQGRTSAPWLLFLLPFLALFSGGYISAKIAGVRGMNLGFKSGAYVALPYIVIMVLASSMFSLNIILASINIDIPTTIFFSLVEGIIFGGIGGAYKGIRGG